MPEAPKHPSLFEQEDPKSEFRRKIEEEATQAAWAHRASNASRPTFESGHESVQDDLGGGIREAHLGQLPGQNVPRSSLDRLGRSSNPTSGLRRHKGSTGSDAAHKRVAETSELIAAMGNRTDQDRDAALAKINDARAALDNAEPVVSVEPATGHKLTGEGAVAVDYARTKQAQINNAQPAEKTIINPKFTPDTAADAHDQLAQVPRIVTEEVDHLGDPVNLINPN